MLKTVGYPLFTQLVAGVLTNVLALFSECPAS
jgi:hypothetical protein